MTPVDLVMLHMKSVMQLLVIVFSLITLSDFITSVMLAFTIKE